MALEGRYLVLAASTQRDVEDGQCDVERSFDSLKPAKEYARYCLTEEARVSAEASETLGYSAVYDTKGGDRVCVADYFGAGGAK